MVVCEMNIKMKNGEDWNLVSEIDTGWLRSTKKTNGDLF